MAIYRSLEKATMVGVYLDQSYEITSCMSFTTHKIAGSDTNFRLPVTVMLMHAPTSGVKQAIRLSGYHNQVG